MAFATPVFDAFYDMVQTMGSESPPDRTKRANSSLHQLLQQQGWVTTLPMRYGYWAFVCAFAPDTTDFTSSKLVLYYKELPCDRTRLDTFYSKVKYSREQVTQFLQNQKRNLKYPVIKFEAYQAFYQIVETSMHNAPDLRFNPHVLWQLDKMYQGK